MFRVYALYPETLSDTQEILSKTSILWASPAVSIFGDGLDHYLQVMLEDGDKEAILIEMSEKDIRVKWLN